MKEVTASSQSSAKSALFIAPAALLAYTLMLFGDGLFSARDVVLADHDIRYFFATRAFGFGELRAGNLPLWNPYMFSGYPYLANFTSALLYPLNAIYLMLPVTNALNVEIALHTWLLGVFMYAWVRGRGVCRLASFFSAVVVMSSGVFVAHLRVGHLSMIDSWAWAPLVFLAADKLIGDSQPPRSQCSGIVTTIESKIQAPKSKIPWLFLGILAVTLQILAGHPQCVYYTAFTLGAYCALRLCFVAHRFRKIGLLAVMAIAPVLLSAAQLAPGLAISRECTRAGGADVAFASSFSLPRENVMRLVAPDIFGSAFKPGSHWLGRSFDHESACFVGVTALVLALVGALRFRGRLRWMCIAMIALTATLALGSSTPLFALAYHGVPGFAFFRAPARFLFFATMFGALLAGMGAHHLLTCPGANKRFAAAGLGIMALFIAAGNWLARGSSVDLSTLVWPVFITFVLAVCLILSGTRRPWAIRAVLIVGLMELSLYAHGNRSLLPATAFDDPAVNDLIAQHPGDYRVLDSPALTIERQVRNRIANVWGSDPIMLDRYAQLVAAAGYPIEMRPEEVSPMLDRHLLSLLRCRYYIDGKSDMPEITEIGEPFPRFYFVHDYRVMPKEQILDAIVDPAVDLRTTALLESEPNPQPAPKTPAAPADTVNVLESSTDFVTIEASLGNPAILINTDAYSIGWRAASVGDSPQSSYEILPAFHGLRAIPLAAGRHTIRLEYAPRAFDVGVWVSGVSWVVFGAAVLGWAALRKRVESRRDVDNQ
ncbi:MAG: hypothetical protein K1Y02_24200 [Candidatus Hydrogenedentes bacterium]|nr:hypothetical protein [Candidatus Hydrogenedentota bacterium]